MPNSTNNEDLLARLPRILIAAAFIPAIAIVVIAVCSVVGR